MSIEDDDSDSVRGTWVGKLDFILSAIGYTVGLGNVWRFPYMAFKNGGASFLFPYLIMLAITGIPIFFMDACLGQFTSEGPITVWKMAPLFTGIGYAMLIVSAAVCIYYNVLISYALYYMLVAFVNLDDALPWESCDNWWNTEHCTLKLSTGAEANQSFHNNLIGVADCISVSVGAKNYTMEFLPTTTQDDFFNESLETLDQLARHCLRVKNESFKEESTTAAQEFLERYVLREYHSPDLNYLGKISPKICVSLLLAWLLVFACLAKGIKSVGKVVHWTATCPFFLLLIMLIKGVSLEGHMDGIYYYVIPQWSKLLDITVWREAATQVFFSIGIGFGGILTLASYNKFQANCYRDTFIVSFINSGTSIVAGFTIFSVLGHVAHVTGRNVADIASSNMDLAFIAYLNGLSRIPASAFWALIFFLMIVTLGLDSQFGMMETVISAISDLFPRVLRKHKTSFTFCCCLGGFMLGIPQTFHGGRRVLGLLHEFSACYPTMLITLAKVVCICYVYGVNNFRDDIKLMLGFTPKYYWVVTWTVLTPLSIVFIIAMTIVQQINPDSPKNMASRPDWATAVGWIITSIPMVAMVLVAVIQAFRYGWPAMIKPTSSWGPALPENRKGRYVKRDRKKSAFDFIPSDRTTGWTLAIIVDGISASDNNAQQQPIAMAELASDAITGSCTGVKATITFDSRSPIVQNGACATGLAQPTNSVDVGQSVQASTSSV